MHSREMEAKERRFPVPKLEARLNNVGYYVCKMQQTAAPSYTFTFATTQNVILLLAVRFEPQRSLVVANLTGSTLSTPQCLNWVCVSVSVWACLCLCECTMVVLHKYSWALRGCPFIRTGSWYFCTCVQHINVAPDRRCCTKYSARSQDHYGRLPRETSLTALLREFHWTSRMSRYNKYMLHSGMCVSTVCTTPLFWFAHC